MSRFYSALSRYGLVLSYLGSLTAFLVGRYTFRSGNDAMGALIIGGSLLVGSTSFLHGKTSLLGKRIDEICNILVEAG
jgi:hypothetical protein